MIRLRQGKAQAARSATGKGLPVGRMAGALLLSLLVLSLSLQGLPTLRAETPFAQHAGLVIQFGEGITHTACVDLGPDGEATGEEVLRAAGFPLLVEYSNLGAAVCKIDSLGCDFPAQSCWCQCQGSPCVYWAYHHLVDGGWQYSGFGAASYRVRAGDVEGWAWGEGADGVGAEPPLITFEQICVAPTETPTATATSAPTETPTATATPTFTPRPPATPTATWTSTPVPTNTPLPSPTWTPQPTATWTPQPAGTPTSQESPVTPALSPTATHTPLPEPTATAPPPATATPDLPAPATGDAARGPEPGWAGEAFLPMVSLGVRAQPQQPPVVAEPVTTATPSPTPGPTPGPTATETAIVPAAADPPAASGERTTIGDDTAAIAARGRQPIRSVLASGPEGAVAVTGVAPDYVFLAVAMLVLTAGIAALRYARPGRRSALGRMNRGRGGWQVAWPRIQPPALGLQRSTLLIYTLTVLLGMMAFLYPFLVPALQPAGHSADGPLLLMVLVGICFLAMLFEIQNQAASAKLVALLGILVSINAVLRFLEVGIPGPGGFSPVFFLIVLTGYIYGGRFGFLMGALTLLVSGLITGGVGPWLPGQMFVAGWVGLTAPLMRPLVRMLGGREGGRVEVVVLAAFGGLWGVGFGLLMNLWFWPFMTGPTGQHWEAGLALADTARRYAAFYLATSLVWDVMRVAGNVLLILAFGAPTLRALRRFRQRFDFDYRPIAPAESRS